MKTFFKTDRRFLYNVLFALILGVFFGNFLGNRIINEETLGVVADVYENEVYLIQSGIYYDELSAQVAANEIEELGVDSIIVKEYNKYYVYHDIARSESNFNEMVDLFDEQQIDYFIKERILFTLIEKFGLDENDQSMAAEYDFYFASMSYYITMLKGSSITFSDEYLAAVDNSNMQLFNNLNALNNNLYTELAPRYELLVYKTLAEILM